MNRQDSENIIRRLAAWCEERKFRGYDPYDALNSPLMGILSLNTRYGRIAWTQFFRRCPMNFRKLFLIAPGLNPKGLGLFLEAYVKLYTATGEEHFLKIADRLFEELLALRTPGEKGAAWGYNFPWQNRIDLQPAYTPTLVNSSFIGNAILDYYEATRKEQALEVAAAIPEFALNRLRRKQEGDSFCFSYTPNDHTFVHNANMLGAALLARISKMTGNTALLDPAFAALSYSMKHQHEDGSWYFAEPEKQHWIDSFHTGFKLESLRRFLNMGLTPEYQSRYRAGVEFYARNFFHEDGKAKYYHDHDYLVDIHAPAEAIYFFAREKEYPDLSAKVLNWVCNHMYDRKNGTFYFREHPAFTIKIPYMRWGQAWMMRGLSEYFAVK